jgi:hypothetical protein
MTFAQAVVEMQPMFSNIDDRALATYIVSPDRLPEAKAVEGCAKRAVQGEIDPSGRLAISRHRLTKWSPPGLAEYLVERGKLDPAAPEWAEVLARSVSKVLACGWLYCCTPQAHIVPARDERSIWKAWAPSLDETSQLINVVEKSFAEVIQQTGINILGDDLKQLEIGGLKGRLKREMIAVHIITLGFYLRMTQTNEIKEDTFERYSADYFRTSETNGEIGQWAWSAYQDA